jgi:hypothetical protein
LDKLLVLDSTILAASFYNSPTVGSVVGEMMLSNCTLKATNGAVRADKTTITKLSFYNCSAADSSTTGFVRVYNTGVVSELSFTLCNINGDKVLAKQEQAPARIDEIVINNCHIEDCEGIIDTPLSSTIDTKITVSDTKFVNCAFLIKTTAIGVTFRYSNIDVDTTGFPFQINSAATLDVTGSGWNGYATTAITGGTGQPITVKAWDFPIDVSFLTPNAGDYANNTDAGDGGGVGPNVYSGSAWTRLY